MDDDEKTRDGSNKSIKWDIQDNKAKPLWRAGLRCSDTANQPNAK